MRTWVGLRLVDLGMALAGLGDRIIPVTIDTTTGNPFYTPQIHSIAECGAHSAEDHCLPNFAKYVEQSQRAGRADQDKEGQP